MAISHAHPLLLLLLVSLFLLPASSINFEKCFTGNHKFIEVKTVDLSPDPVKRSSGNGNLTVTGYTSKQIPDGVTVTLGLTIPLLAYRESYPLCDVTACPVAPGPFDLTIPNIFPPKEERARAYSVVVAITEKPWDLAVTPMMCVFFDCKIRDYTSLLSQVTE